MKKECLWFIVVIVMMALASGGAYAATTMWLSTDASGTPIAGDTITVAGDASVPLYAFLESDAIGNVFELMVGYDTSDAATYGAGKDTNDGAGKKLTLANSQSVIEGTMPASFTVLKSAVLDASGREDSNTYLAGRPYGFVGRAATYSNAAPGKLLCFSFTLQNNMGTAGDYQYVVLSAKTGGNSYCDAWKYGTTLFESSYALKVVSSGSNKSTVGASNKSILDNAAKTAASKYNWVLWGTVTVIDANSFYIDDGSGINVKVLYSGHNLTGGNYVSVKGSLDLSGATPILTGQQIIQRN